MPAAKPTKAEATTPAPRSAGRRKGKSRAAAVTAAVVAAPRALDPTARAALQRALVKDQCERSLLAFVKRFWHILEPGRTMVDGWALRAICDHLEAVERGDIKRLLMNVSPGFMKSLLTDVYYPAWVWGPRNSAYKRIVAFSYAAHLTERDNGRFRDLVKSPEYQAMWGDRVALTEDGKIRVANTEKGWKFATSVRGVSTGERGDIVILDDPHNVKEGESETIRGETVRWFNEAMQSRVNDPKDSAIIVIMQRVHESDVSGEIIKNYTDYTHLCIPMEYDPKLVKATPWFTDPRTEDGEMAWPERFPPDYLATFRKQPYLWAGQYQQTPEVRGGAIIRRNTWQPWLDTKWPKFTFVLASLDTAFTEQTSNDPSALTIWGVHNDWDGVPRVVLMDAWEDHLTLNNLVTRVGAYCGRPAESKWGRKGYSVDKLIIEAKASGISVAQEIRRLYGSTAFNVQLIDPKAQDKIARAHAVSHFFDEGIIQAPFKSKPGRPMEPDEPRAYAGKVIDQCAKFPRASHDDLVDTVTMALRWLRDRNILARKPEIDDDERERSMPRPPDKPIYDV